MRLSYFYDGNALIPGNMVFILNQTQELHWHVSHKTVLSLIGILIGQWSLYWKVTQYFHGAVIRWSYLYNGNPYTWKDSLHIDSLVQDCGNSSALAMELPQSCTKSSILKQDPQLTWYCSSRSWLSSGVCVFTKSMDACIWNRKASHEFHTDSSSFSSSGVNWRYDMRITYWQIQQIS